MVARNADVADAQLRLRRVRFGDDVHGAVRDAPADASPTILDGALPDHAPSASMRQLFGAVRRDVADDDHGRRPR